MESPYNTPIGELHHAPNEINYLDYKKEMNACMLVEVCAKLSMQGYVFPTLTNKSIQSSHTYKLKSIKCSYHNMYNLYLKGSFIPNK